MVQLKSFKYIEPENAQDQSAPSSTDQRSSIQDDSISSTAASSLIGGNLTITSESSSKPTSQRPQPQSDDMVSNTTSVLSSNEEYQLAQHDLTDECDETDTDQGTIINNMTEVGPSNKINVEAEGKLSDLDKKRSKLIKQSFSSPQIALKNRNEIQPAASRTPNLGARHQQIQQIMLMSNNQQQQQYPASSGPGNSLPGSPLLFYARGKQCSADSVSQYQYNQSLKQASNHFEIRWHNINLYARKSKIPRFIEDNPIYKLFKNQTNLNQADLLPEKVYYSPPIKHKLNLPPTISEDAELDQHTREAAGSLSPVSSSEIPSQYRQVLNNISGSVFSGQLTAILGPSGVGKTMLLNSLTGRNTLDGTGRVNLIGGATKRMSVVTVPQADVLPGKLTTLEDLRFTSRLKNPKAKFDHKKNIDRIVKLLQMDKFLNTRIEKLSGGEARRLSIGRELLNSPDIMILDEPTSGLDANTCKKIITALRDIVEHSDNTLGRPMSIIITIHQPQQEVLNLFHRAYIIAIGGRAIYEGPPSSLLPTILENSSISKICQLDQLNENPAIVALEVASGEYGTDIITELAIHHENQIYEEFNYNPIMVDNPLDAGQFGSPYSTPRNIIRALQRKSPLVGSPRFDLIQHKTGRFNQSAGIMDSPIGRRTPSQFRSGLNQADRMSNVTSVSYASTYDAELPEPSSKMKVDKRLRRSVVMKTDFISHTMTLMSRCWLLATRDLFLMSIRIIGFLGVAGGMVQIFSHALDPDEHQCPYYESEIDDVPTFVSLAKDRLMNLSEILKQSSSTHLFFFHLVLCVTMVTSALAGLVFPLQMRMFVREYKNGWYTPASFITSQTLAELPVDLIGPIIALVITYPLCNQPTSPYYWREFAYIVIMILASIICKSQAQIVGALLMDSIENSVFISCVFVTPPALLSGIAVRISSMSVPLQIFSYGSFLRYAFESLFVVRYGYGICPCDLETIKGYPLKTSPNAIPPHLDNLARGIIELNSVSSTTIASTIANNQTSLEDASVAQDEPNLFVKFLRLITDAGNMFVPRIEEIGDCNKYRSLYLLDMGIEDNILPKWLGIMVLIFVVSRFITYFVVKAVIKGRHN